MEYLLFLCKRSLSPSHPTHWSISKRLWRFSKLISPLLLNKHFNICYLTFHNVYEYMWLHLCFQGYHLIHHKYVSIADGLLSAKMAMENLILHLYRFPSPPQHLRSLQQTYVWQIQDSMYRYIPSIDGLYVYLWFFQQNMTFYAHVSHFFCTIGFYHCLIINPFCYFVRAISWKGTSINWGPLTIEMYADKSLGKLWKWISN